MAHSNRLARRRRKTGSRGSCGVKGRGNAEIGEQTAQPTLKNAERIVRQE
jgi:hypothetical protein